MFPLDKQECALNIESCKCVSISHIVSILVLYMGLINKVDMVCLSLVGYGV